MVLRDSSFSSSYSVLIEGLVCKHKGYVGDEITTTVVVVRLVMVARRFDAHRQHN